MKWDDAFKIAEQYYTEHGNLLVPCGYTVDGFNLFSWISRQRSRYSRSRGIENSEAKGMKPDQIARLESIGMVWNANDYAWERSFAVAKAYYEEHGNLLVPLDYTKDGVNLSHWIRVQRQIRNGTQKNRKSPMAEEQIQRLDSIGMAWQPYDAMWERSFAVAEAYYRKHGNLSVPKHYEEDGVNLSHWIWAQRRIYAGTGKETSRKLTPEQIQRLESIGMDWAPKTKGFSYYYDLCKRFYEEYGHTDFPNGTIEINGETLPENGEALATWKKQQTDEAFSGKNGGRAWERKKMLREIGIEP